MADLTREDRQRMATEDLRKGFSPPERHEDLLGLSDRDLKLRAGTATHQHYKGGLYRLIGTVRDANIGDGLQLLGPDQRPRVIYEHLYPHQRELWVRDASDFYDQVPDPRGGTKPRFRLLGL